MTHYQLQMTAAAILSIRYLLATFSMSVNLYVTPLLNRFKINDYPNIYPKNRAVLRVDTGYSKSYSCESFYGLLRDYSR